MKNQSKIILLLALSAIFSISLCIEEEKEVLILNETNFDEAIKEHEYILVEFYAPWCGHCKKLAPEYERAAHILRQDQTPLYLAKCDATENRELAENYGVKGFPTIKLFIKGVPSDYEGERNEKAIVQWMRKKSGPASKEVKTVAEIEKLTEENDALLIFMGTDPEQFAIYETFAKSTDSLVFTHCAEKECLDKYQLQNGNVLLLKQFDEKRNDLTEKLTAENILDFATKFSTPLVMPFDQKSAQYIFGENVPGLFLYRDPKDEKSKALENIFREVADLFKGNIQAIVTGLTEGLETKLAEYIGIKEDELPSVRIHDTTGELKKFTMKGEITKENMIQFLKDWEEGKLKPIIKSEPIPETQDKPVYKLVGLNFEKIVIEQDKDVLVKFYSPDCGHCKQMAPIYEELANKLKHNDKLIIAEFDATVNEVERVSVTSFPRIKLFKASDKSKIVDFEGERENVQSYIDFLQKEATHPITFKSEEL